MLEFMIMVVGIIIGGAYYLHDAYAYEYAYENYEYEHTQF